MNIHICCIDSLIVRQLFATVAFVIWNVRGKGGAQFLEKARCLPEKNAKILTERNGEKALFFSLSGAEQ